MSKDTQTEHHPYIPASVPLWFASIQLGVIILFAVLLACMPKASNETSQEYWESVKADKQVELDEKQAELDELQARIDRLKVERPEQPPVVKPFNGIPEGFEYPSPEEDPPGPGGIL